MSALVSAIIVAAGKGMRMNAGIPKQYLPLAGKPILLHTLDRFLGCGCVDRIILTVPGEDVDYCRTLLRALPPAAKIRIVPGGETRQESVYQGLLAVEESSAIVLIHDGVRPFVTHAEIKACVDTALSLDACILGVEPHETVKQIDPEGNIASTLSRSTLRLAQTPQAFRYVLIRKAHEQAMKNGLSGTDDAMLVEAMGFSVRVLPGSRRNIKITTQEDLALAEDLVALF